MKGTMKGKVESECFSSFINKIVKKRCAHKLIMRKKRGEMRKIMKKRVSLAILVVLLVSIVQGCSFGSVSKDKVRDLSYTIVPEEDIPEELKTIIEEKKAQAFQLSYAAGDDLYIAIGYGEQKTGGYSIVLEELYTTEDSVVVATNLLGPGSDEEVKNTPTYPYIVVKTEYLDLPVVYSGAENSFAE